MQVRLWDAHQLRECITTLTVIIWHAHFSLNTSLSLPFTSCYYRVFVFYLQQCTAVTDVNCVCSDNTHNALAACFNCLLRLENYNSTELSTAQATLQSKCSPRLTRFLSLIWSSSVLLAGRAGYESDCQQEGVNLNPITLSSGASETAMSAAAIVGAVGAAVAVIAL